MDFNRHKGIDLHIHSTASDGSLTPSEILAQAHSQALAAIAITDHDTIEGVKAALSATLPPSLQIMAGVEISAQAPVPYAIQSSLHILGYGFDPNHNALPRILDRLQESRNGRIPLIIDKLNHLGMDLSFEEVGEQVGDGLAGRPHVASVMVRKGYARDVNDAFDRFLSKGQPAYVDKYRMEAEIVMRVIRDAGGVSVLAHPGLIDLPRETVAELIADLKSKGLSGLEVLYPEHPPDMITFLSGVAEAHDLLITGGTDFHGDIKPDIQIGNGRGDFFVPYDVYDNLLRHTASTR